MPIIGAISILAGAGAASLNGFSYGGGTVRLTFAVSAAAAASLVVARLMAFSTTGKQEGVTASVALAATGRCRSRSLGLAPQGEAGAVL